MPTRPRPLLVLAALSLVATLVPPPPACAQDDPLPSWNDGPARRAIVRFVARVATEGSPEFVPADARIAAFDNDGTLWSEQPLYFQTQFVAGRVRALAGRHPEWSGRQPFKAALEGDVKTLAAGGTPALLELLGASHAGMTTDEFDAIARDWLATARHPRFGRPYTELVYEPMRELLGFLRAHGFRTFIVSGSGTDFMRLMAEKAYGIPPERVIGSSLKVAYELRDGRPVLVYRPEVDFIDNHAGKPVGIHKLVGRRPIAAFGNSDGDFEMLRWTTAGPGARLGLLVHHTDARREWAYDRASAVGRLDKALDAAPEHGWTVVDMEKDWKVIYPFEAPAATPADGPGRPPARRPNTPNPQRPILPHP